MSNWLPAQAGAATMLDIDMASHPELVGHVADWHPVSHTISTTEDGDIVMSVLLTREVGAPDSLEGLG